MPLVKTVLDTEISKIMDKDFNEFEGFPATVAEASVRWSEAINVYASVVIPITTTSPVAKTAMEGVLATITIDGIIKFPQSFTAYAVELAKGMSPTFTGVPPPAPILFASAFAIGIAGGSGAEVGSAMSVIIDAWFRTGTAVNVSSGATVPWS